MQGLEFTLGVFGVISQTLMPKAAGQGRVLGVEILIPNQAIRNLVREDKVHQIYSQMQIGQAKHQMQTMNQSLCTLYLRRSITLEEAIGRSSDPDELQTMIGNATKTGQAPIPSGQQRQQGGR